MRRVLFVAYHYPPVGGAGVQRSLQFVRHLPARGWQPEVLTGPGEQYGEWAPLDSSLEGKLERPPAVDRVPGPVPEPTSHARARVERLLALPSPFSRWWRAAIRAAAERHRGVDAVFASLSPFESAEPAADVARALGVPLVLDLRDPWALDEMLSWISGAHLRVELRRMRHALERADAVVMNTPEAARRVRAAFGELRLVEVITNGFDGADFAGPPPALDPDHFRIVHTGAIHTSFSHESHRAVNLRRRLGGISPADPYTRSHVYLLQALRQVDPELRAKVELHMAGGLTDHDRELDDLGVLREHGYLAHSDSVALLRSADLLFLPMHALPPGHRSTIVPGKTYEYLGSGRPVLGAVPDGDARDILEGIPWAKVTDPRDADAMARVVTAAATAKFAGRPAPDGDVALVAEYERRALTDRLAAVLDAVTREGSRPERPRTW